MTFCLCTTQIHVSLYTKCMYSFLTASDINSKVPNSESRLNQMFKVENPGQIPFPLWAGSAGYIAISKAKKQERGRHNGSQDGGGGGRGPWEWEESLRWAIAWVGWVVLGNQEPIAPPQASGWESFVPWLTQRKTERHRQQREWILESNLLKVHRWEFKM